MAVVVVVVAWVGGGGGGGAEEVRDVGVAAGAEEVVAASTAGAGAGAGVLLLSGVGGVVRLGVIIIISGGEFGRQRIRDDGQHRAHVGEGGPEAVVGGEVGGVQLAGTGGPEVFGVVGVGEDVHVDDLGAVEGGEAEDGFGGEGEGEAGAGGEGLR